MRVKSLYWGNVGAWYQSKKRCHETIPDQWFIVCILKIMKDVRLEEESRSKIVFSDM